MATPIGVMSKRLSGSKPWWARICEATRLGGVPTRVVTPPRMTPKVSGMKSFEGGVSVWAAIEATAGISMATAATLFIHAESSAEASISTTSSRVWSPPAQRAMRRPKASATPVSRKAVLMKKMPKMVMTTGEAKPSKASAGRR